MRMSALASLDFLNTLVLMCSHEFCMSCVCIPVSQLARVMQASSTHMRVKTVLLADEPALGANERVELLVESLMCSSTAGIPQRHWRRALHTALNTHTHTHTQRLARLLKRIQGVPCTHYLK